MSLYSLFIIAFVLAGLGSLSGRSESMLVLYTVGSGEANKYLIDIAYMMRGACGATGSRSWAVNRSQARAKPRTRTRTNILYLYLYTELLLRVNITKQKVI
jgi:ethanolamine utilization protein EutA (predicted chaperonin)